MFSVICYYVVINTALGGQSHNGSIAESGLGTGHTIMGRVHPFSSCHTMLVLINIDIPCAACLCLTGSNGFGMASNIVTAHEDYEKIPQVPKWYCHQGD